MRKISLTLLLAIFALCFIVENNIYALQKTTHFELNGTAVKLKKDDLNPYLKSSLGFAKGIEEIVAGQQVIKWIQDGGKAEDEPAYSRSFNHFLNPIDNTGYLGQFKTAREWALEQGTFGSLFGGDYSIF